jgi:transposase
VVEPETDNVFALILPEVNTHNMQVFIDEYAKTIAPDDHIALFIDGAGWHSAGALKFPANITPFKLPPYAPEVNPIERIWEHLKERYLSQRLLNDYDAIVAATCVAWQKLIADAGRITSLTWTPWKTVSQE